MVHGSLLRGLVTGDVHENSLSDGDRILDEKYCFSAGYPTYDWISDQRIINVPNWVDASASSLEVGNRT